MAISRNNCTAIHSNETYQAGEINQILGIKIKLEHDLLRTKEGEKETPSTNDRYTLITSNPSHQPTKKNR
jgi:hypothetical protein